MFLKALNCQDIKCIPIIDFYMHVLVSEEVMFICYKVISDNLCNIKFDIAGSALSKYNEEFSLLNK